MESTNPANMIRQVHPASGFLSQAEKQQLLALIMQATDRNGLGDALTALWDQQKAIGFILGTPSRGENLTDESKFLSKNVGRYWLLHNDARKRRKDIAFLQERRILEQNPRFVYEKLQHGCYSHYPARQHGFEDVCFLCSAERANPNEVLVLFELAGSEFVYGANYATLGCSHFTVWTKVPILQKYWPFDTLHWLCEHGDKIACDSFTTFFNGLGAGNSIKHFHYQTLREPFPIFDAEVRYNLTASDISRLEWPLPAYRMILPINQDRRKLLSQLDTMILAWVGKDLSNTLNLAHRTDANGSTCLIFIPRIDAPDKHRPPQITNDFGGCEVCGRINIENRSEWTNATTFQESTINGMLETVAPLAVQIERLESSWKK